MKILQTIIGSAQGLLALFTLFTIICKPFRTWLFERQQKKQEDDDETMRQREAIKCLLRNEIVHIYYRNCPAKTIHSYDFQNVSLLYKAYKELGGNSFIDKIWAEMQEWTILP